MQNRRRNRQLANHRQGSAAEAVRWWSAAAVGSEGGTDHLRRVDIALWWHAVERMAALLDVDAMLARKLCTPEYVIQ